MTSPPRPFSHHHISTQRSLHVIRVFLRSLIRETQLYFLRLHIPNFAASLRDRDTVCGHELLLGAVSIGLAVKHERVERTADLLVF